MRPVIIAGNWKMNGLPAEAGPLALSIAQAMAHPEVTRVLSPPFVSLAAVAASLEGTGVEVGAQAGRVRARGPAADAVGHFGPELDGNRREKSLLLPSPHLPRLRAVLTVRARAARAAPSACPPAGRGCSSRSAAPACRAG